MQHKKVVSSKYNSGMSQSDVPPPPPSQNVYNLMTPPSPPAVGRHLCMTPSHKNKLHLTVSLLRFVFC